MSLIFDYDAHQKMTFRGLSCDCGHEHALPEPDIYVGTGLLKRLPDLIRSRDLGRRATLVADENTWPLAGKSLVASLQKAGVRVDLCQLKRQGDVEPDETACGELLLAMTDETDFLISVGSGSLCDITRIVAWRTQKPFVCVGTAPSMDGYTSVIAPLLWRKTKIHRNAKAPVIIVCDLDLLSTAPSTMVTAGVGDVLGKYLAWADWKLGEIINGETYCPLCGDIVLAAVDDMLDHLDSIEKKSRQGMQKLIEALLLAGITIGIIGHTRAVSSVEHSIVHLWDMQKLAQDERPPSHGLAVGLSTCLIWPLYSRFADEDLASLDLDAIFRQRLTREERQKRLIDVYGRDAAEAIIAENPEDFLTWQEQSLRIKAAQSQHAKIAGVFKALPKLETLRQALQTLGAPLDPRELGLQDDKVRLALRYGKDYRSRYTLLKLLEECGLLESYLSELPLR